MKQEQYFKIAYRVQEKFDFYLVALAFTVLGLSVQTSRFGKGSVSDAAELAGWLLLLLSGLVGIDKVSSMPRLFQLIGLRADPVTSAVLRETKKAMSAGYAVVNEESGEALNPANVIADAQARQGKLDEAIDKVQTKRGGQHLTQRRLLVAGLVALMIARGLPPLVNLFGYRLLGGEATPGR